MTESRFISSHNGAVSHKSGGYLPGEDRHPTQVVGEADRRHHQDPDGGDPAGSRGIKITRGANQINVQVDYVVPIEFPGYTYQWHVHHEASNPIF